MQHQFTIMVSSGCFALQDKLSKWRQNLNVQMMSSDQGLGESGEEELPFDRKRPPTDPGTATCKSYKKKRSLQLAQKGASTQEVHHFVANGWLQVAFRAVVV